MAPAAPPFHGRNYGLDVLRSWAVLFVLLAHGSSVFFKHPSLAQLTQFLGWLGFVGVELFFALSGFLIGGILLRSGDSLRNLGGIYQFWRKRWYRTLPNYYVYLLLHLALTFPLATLLPALAAHWKYALFVQAWAWPHPAFFGEAWSLAIEEWFYLLTPIFIALLLALRLTVRQAFLVAVPAFIATALLLRWGVSVTDATLSLDVHRKVVLLRLDAIMYGVAIAMLRHYRPRSFGQLRHVLLGLGAALLAGIYFYPFWTRVDILHDLRFNVWALAGTPLACACLIPFFHGVRQRIPGVVRFHFMTARLSYSLYLCNLLVLSFLARHLIPAPPTQTSAVMLTLLFILLCYGVAELSYRWVEQPWLALRDRARRPQAAG